MHAIRIRGPSRTILVCRITTLPLYAMRSTDRGDREVGSGRRSGLNPVIMSAPVEVEATPYRSTGARGQVPTGPEGATEVIGVFPQGKSFNFYYKNEVTYRRPYGVKELRSFSTATYSTLCKLYYLE